MSLFYSKILENFSISTLFKLIHIFKNILMISSFYSEEE